MQKKVAVRYCGGCVPMFDRFRFADRLRSAVPEVELTAYRPDGGCCGIVMICACTAACVDYAGLPDSLPRFAVTEAEDLEKAADFLRTLSRNA